MQLVKVVDRFGSFLVTKTPVGFNVMEEIKAPLVVVASLSHHGSLLEARTRAATQSGMPMRVAVGSETKPKSAYKDFASIKSNSK